MIYYRRNDNFSNSWQTVYQSQWHWSIIRAWYIPLANSLEEVSPDSKVDGANMGPTWVLSAPGGPHVGPINLAIWETTSHTSGFMHSSFYILHKQVEKMHYFGSWTNILDTSALIMHLRLFFINSFWPNDAIWWLRFGSILAQVMACCLMASSHYLNQCRLIISEILIQQKLIS